MNNPGKLDQPIEEVTTCTECYKEWVYLRRYRQGKTPLLCKECSLAKDREREKNRSRLLREKNKAQDAANIEALRKLLAEGKPEKPPGPSMDEVVRMAMDRGISYGRMRSLLSQGRDV